MLHQDEVIGDTQKQNRIMAQRQPWGCKMFSSLFHESARQKEVAFEKVYRDFAL
jgi:hypothetical protein